MMDKKTFEEMVKTFEEIYDNKKLSSEALKIYFNILKEFDNKEIKEATINCLRTCKYFPKPSEIYQAIPDKYSKYYKRE